MAVKMQEVANLAGVSTSAVSLVINKKSKGQISEKARAKILQAIKTLNYSPCPYGRGLKLKRSRNIGYIIPSNNSYYFDPYFQETTTIIEKALRKHNYSLLFFTFDSGKELRYIFEKNLNNIQMDGIILHAPPSNNSICRAINKAKKEHFPVVVMGRNPILKDIAYVSVDNLKAGYAATQHLIKLGRRKICCIAAFLDCWDGQERLKGYKKALLDNGITFDPKLVECGDLTIQSGYNKLKEIVGRSGVPDGVIAHNDSMAVGAMNFINEQRILRIPEDIAFVGFNNTYIAQYSFPKLTVIDVPTSEIASRAVGIMIGILDGKKHKQDKTLLDFKLIERESSVGNNRIKPVRILATANVL